MSTCSGKRTNSIEGLWYHCGYNGDYEEILYLDSLAFSLMIFKEDVDKGVPINLDFFSRFVGSFRYSDDSIRICLSNEIYDEKSKDLLKQHVEFITPDQIELNPKYDQRLKSVIFNRIHDYPKPPLDLIKRKNEWWPEFKANLEERRKLNLCPDLRTREEVFQDSIDGVNNTVILSTQTEDFGDLIEINSYSESENDSIE